MRRVLRLTTRSIVTAAVGCPCHHGRGHPQASSTPTEPPGTHRHLLLSAANMPAGPSSKSCTNLLCFVHLQRPHTSPALTCMGVYTRSGEKAPYSDRAGSSLLT